MNFCAYNCYLKFEILCFTRRSTHLRNCPHRVRSQLRPQRLHALTLQAEVSVGRAPSILSALSLCLSRRETLSALSFATQRHHFKQVQGRRRVNCNIIAATKVLLSTSHLGRCRPYIRRSTSNVRARTKALVAGAAGIAHPVIVRRRGAVAAYPRIL